MKKKWNEKLFVAKKIKYIEKLSKILYNKKEVI